MAAIATGFGSRLGEEGAAELVSRWRRAYEPPVPASADLGSRTGEKRHNLAGPGVVTSDVDLTVRYHRQRSGRTSLAVVVSLHVRENLSDCLIVPMMPGETAKLTVPRNNYFVVALVMSVPNTLGTPPTLYGIGTAIGQISSNDTTRASVTTKDPTVERMIALGLMTPDGYSQLRIAGAQSQQLPAAPSAQATHATGYAYGNAPYSNGNNGHGNSDPWHGVGTSYANAPYDNGNNGHGNSDPWHGVGTSYANAPYSNGNNGYGYGNTWPGAI
ncbi:hypothetical protein [Nocardia sp. CA-119907]|uniref:hypothetical protein n=1 Tax=Nocardia sp. CA-119907 TaxID=3239973 RepID=UPI003D980762